MSSTPLHVSLSAQGLPEPAVLHANLGTAPLVEHAVRNGEGILAADGPLVVATGKHTGRSAKDKFIVRDAETENTVWWGKTNVPMSPDHFAVLKADFLAELGKRDTLYVADLFGGSQSEHRVNVRVINELAWHNLFIRTLLVRPTADELASFAPEYTIINLPSFKANPERHGCRSDTVIAAPDGTATIIYFNPDGSPKFQVAEPLPEPVEASSEVAPPMGGEPAPDNVQPLVGTIEG